MVDMSTYMDAHEIIEITGMSEAYAYKLIKQLNKELEEKGFITIRGRVSRQYFEERIYGVRMEEQKYASV